jgi:hypothetical protein
LRLQGLRRARAIDRRRVDPDAGIGQDTGEIPGAVLTGKMQELQRHAELQLTPQFREHEVGKRVHIAGSGCDVHKAVFARDLGGVRADGKYRKLPVRIERLELCRDPNRVRAGKDEGREIALRNILRERLDFDHGIAKHLMTARDKFLGRARGVELRPGHEHAHVYPDSAPSGARFKR